MGPQVKPEAQARVNFYTSSPCNIAALDRPAQSSGENRLHELGSRQARTGEFAEKARLTHGAIRWGGKHDEVRACACGQKQAAADAAGEGVEGSFRESPSLEAG